MSTIDMRVCRFCRAHTELMLSHACGECGVVFGVCEECLIEDMTRLGAIQAQCDDHERECIAYVSNRIGNF